MLKHLLVTAATEAVVMTTMATLKPEFWSDHSVLIYIVAGSVLVGVAVFDLLRKKAPKRADVGGDTYYQTHSGSGDNRMDF